jgi:hypothetical protein
MCARPSRPTLLPACYNTRCWRFCAIVGSCPQLYARGRLQPGMCGEAGCSRSRSESPGVERSVGNLGISTHDMDSMTCIPQRDSVALRVSASTESRPVPPASVHFPSCNMGLDNRAVACVLPTRCQRAAARQSVVGSDPGCAIVTRTPTSASNDAQDTPDCAEVTPMASSCRLPGAERLSLEQQQVVKPPPGLGLGLAAACFSSTRTTFLRSYFSVGPSATPPVYQHGAPHPSKPCSSPALAAALPAHPPGHQQHHQQCHQCHPLG